MRKLWLWIQKLEFEILHPFWGSKPSNLCLSQKLYAPLFCGGRGYIFCLLSGRYPTTNRLGIVFLQRVLQNLMVPWNIFSSTALHKTCTKMYNLFHNVSTESDKLSTVVNIVLQSDNQQLRMHFLLDCTILPTVIQITRLLGKHMTWLLYIGQTWCYNIHRERMNQLGLLSFRWFSKWRWTP